MSDARWAPDPTGRHAQRYWDGQQWTEHVADAAGGQSVDPLEGPPQDAPTAAGTTGPAPSGASAGGGVSGGLMGDGYDEEEFDRVGLQNPRILKVELGPPVMIKRGSMIAHQGRMEFTARSEGGGLGNMLKRAVSDNALMAEATGTGDLFLADDAREIHLLELAGGGVMVNGPNLLAFEPSLSWETVRFKGASLMSGGGLFGMRLQGSGWVAVTCHGTPVRLDTGTAETFVDAQAAVAWSAATPMTVNVQKLSFGSVRSGELAQLQFGGPGFVLVQGSEGPTVPEHSHS